MGENVPPDDHALIIKEASRVKILLFTTVLNAILTMAGLVFSAGIEHQRLNNLEEKLNLAIQYSSELNKYGTSGTTVKFDDMERRLARIEDKLDRLRRDSR